MRTSDELDDLIADELDELMNEALLEDIDRTMAEVTIQAQMKETLGKCSGTTLAQEPDYAHKKEL